MNKDMLNRNGIVDWAYYSDSFDLCNILIGNGFSISLCSRLSYTSLYQKFSKNISNELKSVFEKFETTNFEYILEALEVTKKINSIYNIDSTVLEPIITELKEGLIKVIAETHPSYKDISPSIFRSLSIDFERFNNIYTTNYDIFIYKIILAYNELLDRGYVSRNRYKDNFCDEITKGKLGLDFFSDESRVIKYLHGSLFIFHQNYTYKFVRGSDSDEYITLLKREIQNNNFPLFVAEGKSEDKFNAIKNNYYLRSCYEDLKREKDSLVVYGLSFQESDKHLVDALNSSKIDNIIISIYVGSKNEKEIIDETSRYNLMFPNKSVTFYNSESLFHFTNYHKF
ncbi:DUF4917 family protein [Sphingobacterium sp. xlx-130]|uniref:DUF4917 family protein n=1 Tax=Sphingobacterium sp. xlx-130 TaxID=2654323 RepID=UPI0013DC7C12|nr:DUF4917 family protein [Sphingobacterium sp. xlx-130]